MRTVRVGIAGAGRTTLNKQEIEAIQEARDQAFSALDKTIEAAGG